ncbi:ABC transporter permease [Patescibacteria group bacterium]|nr:ABC transporter permease [Patescibacteria group bacterium]
MLWISVRRVVRSGLVNAWRNAFVSIASIFVMTTTMLLVGSLLILSALIDQFIAYVEDKVDVNVYFVTDAPERDILDFQRELEALPEVRYVTYTNRDSALQEFRARYSGDQNIVGALDELETNPFGASLAIKAKNAENFESIYRFIQSKEESAAGAPLIEKVNYERNRAVIEQLGGVVRTVESVGFAITIIYLLASLAITFNTIRLAIYTAREEIAVMRLVGANNMYIRSPFMVEGTLYGAISGTIALILFLPISYFLRGASQAFFGADIFAYYLVHLPLFFAVLVIGGAVLGGLSAFLAVRKYLSV